MVNLIFIRKDESIGQNFEYLVRMLVDMCEEILKAKTLCEIERSWEFMDTA